MVWQHRRAEKPPIKPTSALLTVCGSLDRGKCFGRTMGPDAPWNIGRVGDLQSISRTFRLAARTKTGCVSNWEPNRAILSPHFPGCFMPIGPSFAHGLGN